MPCPDETTLERLVLGQLPLADADVLARHLEECDRCVATVQTLRTDDTLTEAARASQPDDESHADAVASLVERLSGMYTTAAFESSEKRGGSADLQGILAPPQGPAELGRLGPYCVLKVLGAGGMGVVFQAEDPVLKRRVALKTLQPGIAACPAARERFLREARAVAAIEDERIVAIHHVGEDRGLPYFAMPLLRGQSLEERLREVERATGVRMLPATESVHIASETAHGLASAHARGLIHRDIKPANIWLEARDEGRGTRNKTSLPPPLSPLAPRIKILDFGLARGIDDAMALTQPGVVAGTPAYLAPEQLTGAVADERCDLFGLGCVLYRMTTGRTPFAPGREFAAPASPRELNPEVPGELADLIVELLAGDPAQRPPSAQAVAARLTEIGEGLSSVTIAPSLPRRSRRLAWAAGIAAAFALVAALTVMVVRTDRGEFVVEIDDPDVAVLLAQAGGITLHDRKTDRTYVLSVGKHDLPSGEYEIDVRDIAKKLEFSTPRFTIQRGDQTKVTVSLRGQQRAWLNYVAALPAQKQLEVVSQKLRDLNPDFKAEIGPRIEDGKVVEAHIKTDHVTDISPFRALADLEILVIHGSGSAKGVLEDISPVRSLKHLRYLDCSANRVRDLSPLRGMPLTELSCWANPIRDLTPLRGMPLKMLEANYTYASDLWPLHNMPLQRLHVSTHYAADLTPLASLPLVELHCRFRPVRHPQVLRSIKSLAKINNRPVAEFWKEHDERQAAIALWVKRVSALPAEEQVREVTAKLRELNPGFEQSLNAKIENGQVAELSLQTDNVTDLSPLRALTKLRVLNANGSESIKRYDGKLYDLDPLRELPIAQLQVANSIVADLNHLPKKLQVLVCSNTPVHDLKPLRAYPLYFLECTGTLVDDLSPLKGTDITRLHMRDCRVTDLSPLANMSIHWLYGDFDPARDTKTLKAIKTLVEVNGKPAAEFWKEFRPQ